MKNKEQLNLAVVLGTVLILLFSLVLSTSLAFGEQSPSSHAESYAYITNSGDDNVSVIDTANDTVIANVSVGDGPFGVAVSPNGTRVYVTNEWDNNVSIIDTDTNTVMSNVSAGFNPTGVAVSPNGTKVYVANAGNGFRRNISDGKKNFKTVSESNVTTGSVKDDNEVSGLSVIDTENNNVTTIPFGSAFYGVAVNRDGSRIYVTDWNLNKVFIFDTATNTVIGNVSVGSEPQGIAVNPDGTKVYVASFDNVSVIDTTINKVTSTVPIKFARGVAVSPDGLKAYVSSFDNVSVIDTATNNITANISVGEGLEGIAVTPDGTKVYVAKNDNKSVSVIDTTTNTSIDNVSVGNNPSAFGQFIGQKKSTSIACSTSTIYGYSFNSSNGNKEMDVREAGISNMRISLNGYDICKGNLISKTTETNSTGYFTFKDINPGVYVVSENFVIGWLPTTDAAYTLTIPSNSTSIRKDFGNIKFVK